MLPIISAWQLGHFTVLHHTQDNTHDLALDLGHSIRMAQLPVGVSADPFLDPASRSPSLNLTPAAAMVVVN